MKTKVYACYNKNEKIRAKSSSGGIYFLLAREVLQKGGVVYAACYDGLSVKHKKINNEQMLMSSIGSKYIPSELGDTFADIYKNLMFGRTVLFAGLSCQCGGLLSYIQESRCDAENELIVIDLVCHGLPSGSAWHAYCDSLDDRGFQISSVNMRVKSTGWKNYSWLLESSNGKKRLEVHDVNPYMNGFVSDLYLRPACSTCKFRGVERDTDITLGDYWGVKNVQPEMDDNRGTSIVFIHSGKGQALFEEISDKLIYKQAPVDQVIKYNPSIISSASVSDKRAEFFRRLAEGEDFISIIEELAKKPLGVRTQKKVKNLIMKIYRRGGVIYSFIIANWKFYTAPNTTLEVAV